MPPGDETRSLGHWISDIGWVGLGHGSCSVSDQVFDPVLSFNMRIYHGVVSTE